MRLWEVVGNGDGGGGGESLISEEFSEELDSEDCDVEEEHDMNGPVVSQTDPDNESDIDFDLFVVEIRFSIRNAEAFSESIIFADVLLLLMW